MAGASINTVAEGVPKLISTLGMMKMAADANMYLPQIIELETKVMQMFNPSLSQQPQLPPTASPEAAMGGGAGGPMPGPGPMGMAATPGPPPPGGMGIPPRAGPVSSSPDEIRRLLNASGPQGG